MPGCKTRNWLAGNPCQAGNEAGEDTRFPTSEGHLYLKEHIGMPRADRGGVDLPRECLPHRGEVPKLVDGALEQEEGDSEGSWHANLESETSCSPFLLFELNNSLLEYWIGFVEHKFVAQSFDLVHEFLRRHAGIKLMI